MGYPFSPDEPRTSGSRDMPPVPRLWIALAVTAATVLALVLVVLS